MSHPLFMQAEYMTCPDKVRSMLLSRRFLTAVTAVAVIFTQDILGLDSHQATTVAGIIAAWIVGDSINKTS